MTAGKDETTLEPTGAARRRLIKAAGLSAVASLVSFDWQRPMVRLGFLPAHAQGSGSNISCVCNSLWYVGDRVTKTGSASGGPPIGTEGTAISGSPSSPPFLVEWDNWFNGHDGNGAAACPETPDSGTSRWWIECDEFALTNNLDGPPPGDGLPPGEPSGNNVR